MIIDAILVYFYSGGELTRCMCWAFFFLIRAIRYEFSEVSQEEIDVWYDLFFTLLFAIIFGVIFTYTFQWIIIHYYPDCFIASYLKKTYLCFENLAPPSSNGFEISELDLKVESEQKSTQPEHTWLQSLTSVCIFCCVVGVSLMDHV